MIPKEIFNCPKDKTALEHSRELDLRFNLDPKSIELELVKIFDDFNLKSIHNSKTKEKFGGFQSWIGLDEQTLQTPYHEFYDFLSLLKDKDIKHVIDFGAGYGRLAYVVKSFFSNAHVKGFELITERCEYANLKYQENGLKDCHVHQANLLELNFDLLKADLYFLYDFSELSHLNDFIERFKHKLYDEKFYFVARGKGICSLIQNKYPEFWALHGVTHGENWSLYSSFEDLN